MKRTSLNRKNLEKDSSEKQNLAVNKSDIAVNKSNIAIKKSDIAVNKSDIAVNTVQIPTWGGAVRAIVIYTWLCSVANYLFIYFCFCDSWFI